MPSPCFGRIIWAEIPDQRGLVLECHPAMIFTPTRDIDPAGTVWVVGVSTKDHLSLDEVRTPLRYGPHWAMPDETRTTVRGGIGLARRVVGLN